MKRKITKQVARVFVYVDVMMLLILTIITMIHPPVDPSIELRPVAVMTVEWDGMLKSDIDTHLILPNGSHLSYLHKDVGGRVVLHRDDLGRSKGLDGKVIPINLEVVDFFVLDPGRHKVAVKAYSYKDDKPIKVEIKLYTTGTFTRYVDKTITLTASYQTISVVEFTVDDDGNIIDVNTSPTFQLPRY